MEFTYNKIESIAGCAWCCIISKEKEEINLLHGERIETFENGFVEGVWEDIFENFYFENSVFFLGSGAKINNDSILFCTPSHVLERLYGIEINNKLYLSNSLPFILEQTKLNLSENYFDYERAFGSILRGLNNYEKKIPLSDGYELLIFYYCNFEINNNLEIKIQSKINNREFISFEDYETQLLNYLNKIKQNANSPMRRYKYKFTTTISTGYDAPACAAIAKEVGCDIALTFNAPLKYKNDSGAEIAKMLGYTNVICLNANSYINRKDLIEAEFISSGELGTGIVFSSLEEYIKDSIVFFGERGDKIWDKNRKDVNNVFCFEDELYSNTSIIENRLKVGYILLPLPLFGASQWSSLHSISNSNEMKEYSIGGNYDRPIPRRILESRGIKRELFGQEKKGAGFNYRFDNVKRLRKRMSQHSFQYFYSFYKRDTFSGKRYMCLLSFYWKSKYYYIHHIFRLLKINLPIPKRNEIISNPGAPLSLFKWSILIMKKKYKQQ